MGTLHTEAPGEAATLDGAVLVVDDEAGMRSALRRLFLAAKLPVRTFDSGGALLDTADLALAACVVLDVRMPGMDGLAVQAELKRRGVSLPTIFLTGAADVPLAVAAMREGALDFIEKPYEPEHVLERVRQALHLGERQRSRQSERAEAQRRLATLTARERDVMALVVKGLTNKEAARALGTSHRTVDVHRTNLMRKMDAPSLADLVRASLLAEGQEAD